MLLQPIRSCAALSAMLVFASGICAAHQTQTKKKPSAPSSGAQLYKQNCAVCHGNDGKGNGPPPANSPFSVPAPDLTTLAQRHEGKFPEAYVKAVLQNGVKLQDHGPAEMPVWGVLFNAATKSDQKQVAQRIANLTEYLESIQAK